MNRRANDLTAVLGVAGPEVGAYYPTAELVRYWFDRLNDDIFDSRIEPVGTITISNLKGSWAEAIGDGDESHLRIHCKFPTFTDFIIVLSHEMVHLKQWQEEGIMDHGKSFYKWRDRLREFNLPLHRSN